MRTTSILTGALLLGLAVPAIGQDSFGVSYADAKLGRVTAMVALGEAYRDGKGTTQNYTEAFRWFSEASAKGDPKGTRLLGEMYFEGQGVAKDPKEALRHFRAAAAKGEARAMWWVGMSFLIGDAVPKDEVEAVRWYRLSAAKRDPYGQNSLAVMLANGNGVTKNSGEALRLFRLAADQGDTSALFNMADMYRKGNGVAVDTAEAARLLAAAKSPNPKQWRTFVAAPVAVAAPPAAPPPPKPSRFIFMVNNASHDVTIYQDGVQKCFMAPAATCGEVVVEDGASATIRAVLSTGSEATYNRPPNSTLHVCIIDGPRFVECYTNKPL